MTLTKAFSAPAARAAGFDFDRFRNPGAMDRPVPFYSWNEWMEAAEVRRQVDLIADAGWGGVFVHSRVGLTTPYMGEQWFEAVDAAREQCTARGLKVWLYDEDKWPSGYSGGAVPLANPEFRQHTLVARPAGSPPPADSQPLGSVQGGLQIYVWQSPLGHDWFNGTSYSDLMSQGAMQHFLQEAYEPYFARYKDEYGSLIVGEFTDEPCSIFRNRLPEGSLPFTTALPERFQEMHGYDCVPQLHLLYGDGKGAARLRLHYYRTVNDLFENAFSRQLGDWCRERGIMFTGHYMAEDTFVGQQAWGVKIMPNYRHMDIPGVDHLVRQVHQTVTAKQCQSVVNQYSKPRMLCEIYGVAGGSLSFEDRAWIADQQMSLGVNLLNPHLSLYTMAGCRKRDYPQNIFYQQPFWPRNHVLDDGLSRKCAALSQGRYRAEVLVLHPQESVFTAWEPGMDAAHFDGLRGWNWDCASPDATTRINTLDEQFKAVTEALLGAQRTFDYGDETILADAGSVAEEAGRPVLQVRDMNYPLVVMPAMHTISQTTVDLLHAFLDAGGPVVRCGESPSLLDGEESSEVARLLERIPCVETDEIAATVATHVAPLVQFRGGSAEDRKKLFVHVRDMEDGSRLLHLANLNRDRTLTGTLQFEGTWHGAQVLEAQTGETHTIDVQQEGGGVTVEVEFAPAQARLLFYRRDALSGESVSLVTAPAVETLPLPAETWSVERLDDNCLTLDYATWRRGEDEAWSPRPVPVIGIQDCLNSMKYDGPMTMRYPVRVEGLRAERQVHLVVEYPDRYRIRVNEQTIAYAGLPFWRDIRWSPIDITGLLHEGGNTIELHCEQFQHGDLTSIEDQFARYGTEVEAVYLGGDFTVRGTETGEQPVAGEWSQYGLPPIAVRCFAGDSFSVTEPKPLAAGDTTGQGLPFYAGRLAAHAVLPPLAGDGRWFVEVEKMDAAVAMVLLDGEEIGDLVQHPLQVDIPPAACEGGRRLSIVLYGTLRNLMGPHHHPAGELPAVCPGHFSAETFDFGSAPNDWVLRHGRGEPVSGWTDRYCMVSFGDLGSVRLVRREPGPT